MMISKEMLNECGSGRIHGPEVESTWKQHGRKCHQSIILAYCFHAQSFLSQKVAYAEFLRHPPWAITAS